MQDLIASFLFQNKTCPIPGFGNLAISTGGSISDFTNKKINAPETGIHFEQGETNTGSLLSYIAAKTNSSSYEANEALDHYIEALKKELDVSAVAKLPGLGNFFMNSGGEIKFIPEELPTVFFPPVTAERAIHPEAEHPILVGDKESTNTEMTDFFNEVPVQKNRWWIWAIVLGLIGIGVILYYVYDVNASSLFGNAKKN